MEQNNDVIEYNRLWALKDEQIDGQLVENKVCLKLATLNYTVCDDNSVITIIKDKSGKEIKVRLSENSELKHANCGEEPICKKFIHFIYPEHLNNDFIDKLGKYREKQIAAFNELVDSKNGSYYLKLFKIENHGEVDKAKFGRKWIDYVGQLRKQQSNEKKYICDSNNAYGIWASKSSLAESLLTSATEARYGNYALILKPVEDTSYVVTNSEIIGNKFEVVGVFEKQELLTKLRKYISKTNSNGSDEPNAFTKLCENEKMSVNLEQIM